LADREYSLDTILQADTARKTRSRKFENLEERGKGEFGDGDVTLGQSGSQRLTRSCLRNDGGGKEIKIKITSRITIRSRIRMG
jgi:hypothetical protein